MAAKKRKGLGAMSKPTPRREYADTPEELVAEIEARQADDQEQAPARPKAKITISIDADLADELKAAGDTLGRRAFPSASALAERGIRTELEKLRDEHNAGEPFS